MEGEATRSTLCGGWRRTYPRGVAGASYLRGLDAALSGAGLPYGYAVSTWSTGALLLRSHGIPEVSSVFLFAAGASAAYGFLRLATKPVASDARLQLATSPHLVRAGAIHVAAMMLAATAAALASSITADIAWLLAPFAATVTYLTVTSLELALMVRHFDRAPPRAPDSAVMAPDVAPPPARKGYGGRRRSPTDGPAR